MSKSIDPNNLETFSEDLKFQILNSLNNKNDLIQTCTSLLEASSYTKEGKKIISILIKELESNLEPKVLLGDSTFTEIISYHALKAIFNKDLFEVSYLCGSSSFPDIKIKNKAGELFGFEIKRVGGKDVLGNSSTQVIKHDYIEFYAISFFNDGEDIHISKYQDIIESIEVDHNPRFKLKKQITDKASFNDIYPEGTLIDYFKLPQNEREKIVARYLRKKYENDEDRWFLGQSTAIVEEFLKEIEDTDIDREKLMIYIFGKEPTIFESPNYNKLRLEVLKKFKWLGPVKDIFTAGGKEDELPRIFVNFLRLLPEINTALEEYKIDKQSWKKTVTDSIQTRKNLKSEEKEKIIAAINKEIN